LATYLSDRTFVVRQNSNRSKYFYIKAGVPQGSDIAPFLYNVFTHDIPKTSFTELGTYADDTAITVSNENPTIVSSMIQQYLNIIHLWTKRWKIKINESKSSYITFTLKRKTCPSVTLNNIAIPVYTETKYLGLILDRRLTWASQLGYPTMGSRKTIELSNSAILSINMSLTYLLISLVRH
jgi:hypothetical protein